MSRKGKGTNAERELIHMFWGRGLACIRVAGSGSSGYPSPDIIVGNNALKAVIECKVSKGKYQYFSKEEIAELRKFADKFVAEPYAAVKFNHIGWFFLELSSLEETDRNFAVTPEKAKKNGLSFEDFIAKFNSSS